MPVSIESVTIVAPAIETEEVEAVTVEAVTVETEVIETVFVENVRITDVVLNELIVINALVLARAFMVKGLFAEAAKFTVGADAVLIMPESIEALVIETVEVVTIVVNEFPGALEIVKALLPAVEFFFAHARTLEEIRILTCRAHVKSTPLEEKNERICNEISIDGRNRRLIAQCVGECDGNAEPIKRRVEWTDEF